MRSRNTDTKLPAKERRLTTSSTDNKKLDDLGKKANLNTWLLRGLWMFKMDKDKNPRAVLQSVQSGTHTGTRFQAWIHTMSELLDENLKIF